MNAVATNVLIYAHDPRDKRKQSAATVLIEELTEGVLLWQVACEYLSASRKLEPLGYSVAAAWKDLHDLRQAWTPALPAWEMHGSTERVMQTHGLSFWDALILAACIEAGVTRLYTEDFGKRDSIEGVAIVNPFAP